MLNSGPDDDIYVSHKAHRLDVFGFSVFMPDSVQHHSLCEWPLNVNSYHATGRMKERKKGVMVVKDRLHGNWDILGRVTLCGKTWQCEITW